MCVVLTMETSSSSCSSCPSTGTCGRASGRSASIATGTWACLCARHRHDAHSTATLPPFEQIAEPGLPTWTTWRTRHTCVIPVEALETRAGARACEGDCISTAVPRRLYTLFKPELQHHHLPSAYASMIICRVHKGPSRHGWRARFRPCRSSAVVCRHLHPGALGSGPKSRAASRTVAWAGAGAGAWVQSSTRNNPAHAAGPRSMLREAGPHLWRHGLLSGPSPLLQGHPPAPPGKSSLPLACHRDLGDFGGGSVAHDLPWRRKRLGWFIVVPEGVDCKWVGGRRVMANARSLGVLPWSIQTGANSMGL